MALWDGLLGGGGGDPLDVYGDLFSKEQKAALAQRSASEGLLRMAGAFGQAAQPSRLPTSFMASLGQAAGAMAGHGDETAKTALSAMKVGEDVRTSKQQREWTAKLLPSLVAKLAALEKANGLPTGTLTSQIPGAGAAPPVAALAASGSGDFSGSTGAPGAGGDFPGAVPSAPGALPALLPIPPAPPGGRITPADYGVYGTPQQNTGLLPPQDQVLGPDGQPLQGPGVLPTMSASYGGAPGGRPPFALASSTPTESGTLGADDWQRVRPLIRKYESGGRNIEQGVVGPQGGYNPSVGRVTGPSSASGYYQMIDPTWRAAARKAGIDTDKYPRAIDAPEELQDKAAEALYREQGLSPWAPYNKALAAATGYRGGGQDTVIPSGRGLPRSALTNVADTGGGLPGGGGVSNMPEQLSTLSAITQLLGLKDPFGSMLETYYKSPNYITEAARARALGENDPLILEQKKRTEYKIDTELKPGLEAAVAREMNGPLQERAKNQAEIDRRTKELEQLGAAGTKFEEVTVAGDDGKPVQKKMSSLEAAIREKLTNERRANKDFTVRPGDIIGTPVLSPEETAAQTQRGKTGQEMTTVQVWTPSGLVSQQMTNLEAAARRKLSSERGPGGPPQIGDIVDAPALTEAEKKVAGALGEDFVALRRQAQAASSTINSTHDLRAKLDSGMFTGMDANWNLFAARLGDALGWKNLSDPEKVKNTEVYISGIGKEVLAMAQALKPASNLDLQFLERAAGGINLSAASVRELLDMRERYARLAIERHNEEARGMSPGTFSGFRREIPPPPAYQPKELVTPSGNKARINRD